MAPTGTIPATLSPKAGFKIGPRLYGFTFRSLGIFVHRRVRISQCVIFLEYDDFEHPQFSELQVSRCPKLATSPRFSGPATQIGPGIVANFRSIHFVLQGQGRTRNRGHPEPHIPHLVDILDPFGQSGGVVITAPSTASCYHARAPIQQNWERSNHDHCVSPGKYWMVMCLRCTARGG